MKKVNFCGAMCALLDYFHEKKLPQFQKNSFVMKLLQNYPFPIYIHGENDVEFQISIQGIHLSAFGNYFWKKEKDALIINTNFYKTPIF